MKTFLVPAVFAFALADGQVLSTQYSAEKSFRVEVQSTFTMETVDFSMERDGEPVEGGWGGGDRRSEETRNVVMVDTILDTKDGAPIQVRRSFETISGSAFMVRGERENESERECPLSGVVIEMTLDDGDVSTEVVEGESPDDDALLEGHQLTLALDAFLPEGEVEADEPWEVDGDALMRALGFDVEKALFPTPQREPRGEGRGERGGGGRRGGQRGGGGGGLARYFANGSWDFEATLEADTEEYEGVACHVVKLEGEASGELPERERGGRDGQDRMVQPGAAGPTFENSFELELEGKLYFSAEGGHPMHLELEGQLSTESVREMERRESLMVISNSQEGTLKYTVDVMPVVAGGEDE